MEPAPSPTWLNATVVAAIVGFAGVIAAQLLNAYWARRAVRDKNREEKEAELHKLGTLRSALRAEIAQLIRVLEGEIKFCKMPDQKFTYVPVLDYFMIYRRNIDRIALLSSKEVEHLTETVHVYEERMAYIAQKGKMSESPGELIGRTVLYPLEDPELRSELLADIKRIVDAAMPALVALDAELAKKKQEP
jgi:hypothetical protein